MTVLVNRGWVSRQLWDPTKRQDGQIKEEVSLTALVRKNESRPQFVPKTVEGSKVLTYR